MEREGYEADLDRLFLYNIKEGTRSWISKGWNFDITNVNWENNGTLYLPVPIWALPRFSKPTQRGREL
ncbi:MAG: hypothetical protein IPJ37_19165 [Bacteroidales bacterium]|nr:hypothetical protein [Bacteroidales bacterium]